MTLRLILMRHAKSSWSSPGRPDHERPLNGRGQRSAVAIGHWLAQRGYEPDLVLSSDSQRTRETWAGVVSALPQRPDVHWQRELYHAPPEVMLNALKGATGQTVMLLGHNPGCAEFAEMLVTNRPAHDRFYDYPTCATLVADIEVDAWSALTWQSARVIDFIVPRDLGVS